MALREIEPDLVYLIDQRLYGNGLAQQAILHKDARMVFGLAAESLVGIREKGGNNKGREVELIQKTIGDAEQEPWCMAFVQSMLAYAELKCEAKSPVFVTEHVMTCWRETPVAQRVKMAPLKYAIVIWRHEHTDSGHTGVVIENNQQSSMITVEGNTNGDGSREGDGIYVKKRDWIRNGDLIKQGFLKPF